jgi:hypothetical protein
MRERNKETVNFSQVTGERSSGSSKGHEGRNSEWLTGNGGKNVTHSQVKSESTSGLFTGHG